ncbi:RWD domain-containing protein 3 [Pelobates fuscus]|uniref:RWD domain-containing protein 3 n=1 Tax=Pelobates fuscus TaxID=191477 RepID=UPI002FE4C67E
MSEAALEEISVLSAIYCEAGEFEVLSHSETGITIIIQTSARRTTDLEINLRFVFDLPPSYPSCLPNLSISSQGLTRAQCKTLRDKVLEKANIHLSEPMIHELILWTQQHFNNFIEVPETSVLDVQQPPSVDVVTDEGIWTMLLHLDHMRAKNKYIKTVEKWATDLELCGRLMFMGKIILILLQGDRSSIKEYLVLQKTCKVDVDSSGKKCKERMIRILWESRLPKEKKRFSAFEVKEYSSMLGLQTEFETAGLKTVFTEFVQTLF